MPNVGVQEEDHWHSSSIPTLCPTCPNQQGQRDYEIERN